jgi:hypothetical protein
LVKACDLVIDGVDVTGKPGWQAKLLLHESAVEARKPVLTGYDMAGTQYIRYYDYRSGGTALDGRIDDRRLSALTTWALLARAVPTRRVPLEMLREARAHLGEADYSVPQLVYASSLFGALASRMAVEIVNGGRVRREVAVDVHDAVRTRADRIGTAVRQGRELLAMTGDLIRLRTGSGKANDAH